MIHSFALSLALIQASAFGGAGPALLFQLAAIFGIFYFLLIRPQQKQRKDHEARLNALKKGDRIVTGGGLIGEVAHIKEAMRDGSAVKTLDDEVTITSGGTRLIVERRGIAKVDNPAAGA